MPAWRPKRGAVLAIDTNIVVRLIATDDPKQAQAVRVLMETETVFVSATVLLEAEWVLRSTYDLDKSSVVRVLTHFAALPNVILAEPDRVATALAWAAEGMDFADALHLAGADACEAFVTFDRKLAKAAAGPAAPPIRLL